MRVFEALGLVLTLFQAVAGAQERDIAVNGREVHFNLD